MTHNARRGFMREVGSGMLSIGLGASLAEDMGFSTAFAANGPDALDFGRLRPLVDAMQDTPAETLQPAVLKKLRDGETDLKQLTAAAALANAETFGGQDYVGFHTAMAFLPAYQMAQRLPRQRQPLPVLKVLWRNAVQTQNLGGQKHITLRPIEAAEFLPDDDLARRILVATRDGEIEHADRFFANTADNTPKQMLDAVQLAAGDSRNVHRFVIAHRAFRMAELVGRRHAHTLLRQCVRMCANMGHYPDDARTFIPKLLDQHKLAGRAYGKRNPGEKWVWDTCEFIRTAPRGPATDAVCAALAEGIDPECVGEAISLAANQAVLRTKPLPAKHKGRTHGGSQGVHAQDAVNAWRNMARETDTFLGMTGFAVATAYMANYDLPHSVAEPFPHESHREKITDTSAESLLATAEKAIHRNGQGTAAAAITVYGEQGYAHQPVFDLMLKYAVSEDGRLHAEKYYQTIAEEFRTTRAAFRWRHLAGLARVTASAYGYSNDDERGHRAPGYEAACRDLGVDA